MAQCNKAWMAALLVVVLCAAPARAEKITIAATVNDDVITSTDLAERRELIMESSHVPPTEENRKRITPRILQSLIEETLEMQEAKRQGITVADSEVAKTMDEIGARQKLPAGGLQKQLAEKGISVRSLENQVRAQLAWNKVVQRKLRRNVTVSQDELVQAQQAQAAAPGVSELHLAALVVPIGQESKEADIKARVEEIGMALKAADFMSVAQQYLGKPDVQFSAPVWVVEENLPADVQRVLRETKPGEVTAPLRTGNVIQFISLIERRVTKKPLAATEVIIKQLTLDLPPKPDKKIQDKITSTVELLRKDAGSCEAAALPTTAMPVTAEFSRLTMGKLAAEQAGIIARLGVGEVSEPLMSKDKLRMVLLCERREPAVMAADTNEELRQELFAEKMDLEAQKHLRNLRREATIDIREGQN